MSLAAGGFAQTNYYVNASAGSSDNWNSTNANVKWTTSGSTYVGASGTAGNVYHTNGYTLRAGRVGNTTGGSPNPYNFSGQLLVIDGFSSASTLTDGSAGGGGILLFELASSATGPRLGSPSTSTKANYVANIATDAIGGTPGSTRTIRGSTGVTTLNGTLRLNGKTTLSVPSGVNDMLFTVKSTVLGTGSIEISGGSAGSGTANGYVTWEFENLSGWTGASISVTNKHTISFTSAVDFTVTNPGAALTFPSTTSVGFLNLGANVSFASGKVTYGASVLPDGTYTASQLNALWNTGGYATQAFAAGSGTLTVKPAAAIAPAITSLTTASGRVGVPFNYLVTAVGETATFGASSLPAGLSINASTGMISGTPSTAGTTNLTVSATNGAGSGTRALAITIAAAPTVTNGWAGGSGAAATANGWNDATSGTAYKWTSDAGVTYTTATSGVTYHTNGYTVKGGRIGSPTGGTVASGPEPYSTFAGDELVIDAYSATSGVTSNATNGTLWFQLANTGAGSDAMVGPRAGDGTNTTTRGTYIADIVTAPTSSGAVRYLRADTGRTTLDGALTLNGDTVFWANTNDVHFVIKSPVTGTGNILLRDGPSGGSQMNGWLMTSFQDLTGWRGASIKAIHKHTLGFAGNIDFSATNPTAIIHFPTTVGGSATVGFLNLSANVTVLPGQLGYGGAFESSSMTTVLNTPGTYTASDLNTLFGVAGFASGSGTVTVVPKMTLVSSGTSQVVLMTKPSPIASVTKAAQELQKHLQLITGATVTISTVGNEGSYPGKKFIYLGANTASTSAGVDTSALSTEYFIIRTVGANLHIVGKDGGNNDWTDLSGCQPATLFGVYYLLGEVMDVRWLWPGDDGIVVNASSTLDLPSLNITTGPHMVQRKYRNPRVGLYKGGSTTYGFGIPVLPASGTTRTALADEEVLWQRRQFMGQRKNPAFGHSETAWWATYGATHPEYFATLLPGHSHPDPSTTLVKLHVSGADTIQARVDAWVAAGSPNSLNLCPNDSRSFCVCASCLAWDYPSQAANVVFGSSDALLGDRYARWYSEVATRVAAINPSATVYGYAYDTYKNAPQVATLPSNVAIAYIPGAPSDVLLDQIAETQTDVLGWIAAGCTQMYLRPNWMLSAHAGPFWPTHRLGNHFKEMLAGGYLLGMDSDSACGSYASFGLYYYLMARQMARPEIDVEAVVDEYCSGFGSASTRVRDYFTYWENFIYNEADNGNTTILGWSSGMNAYGSTYSDAAFDGAEQILDDAQALLAPGETAALARLDFLRAACTNGRLTAKAIRLVDPSTALPYNAQAETAMRDLLTYRDSQAGSFTLWREWMIDRESAIPGMQAYWQYIFANP
ncbi:DUF4838 domain-containing protein [Nibricoccus aquaticus]|uniref:DUF4838 domain-containing protein n=1 Tax=Nibricoccus aquaticus TaxID=2576891 RepID=UPI001585F0B7|nr:DUF4838 domain-containing protein [Nibricoccus aquaticus]